MTKKLLLLFLLLPLLLAGCAKGANTETKVSPLDNKIILFYGDTCPHCKVLEQFMDDNKINERLTMEKREVYKDQANASLMMDAVRRCSLPENNVGVPFLWADSQCYVGEQVTTYFKTKFNTQ